MTIRPVGAADLDRWSAMRLALWPDADREELRSEAEAWLVPERHNTELAAVFVYDPGDGKAAGVLELSLRSHVDGCASSPVPYVEAWYVDEAFRRRGVGRALMEAACDWAVIRGFAEMGSDALVGNVVSERAHAAIGFEEVGRVVQFRRTL